jgi:hypothetical protein
MTRLVGSEMCIRDRLDSDGNDNTWLNFALVDVIGATL